MRLRDVAPAHRTLLAELASGISARLEAEFVELSGTDQPSIGVSLREASRSVVIAMPDTVLAQALETPAGREVLRTRVKARRDRMLFKTPPPPLPKKIAPLLSSGPPRPSFRGGRR
jgi:hypothetical protein